ncbi:MAG TPA: ACT domain-containing protein, partial [Clostridia bacterium]|nr:ACT domain-containing protein [Clostridia bacterium]
GYITRGRGVSVHRTDCVNLIDPSIEEHRLIEVSWDEEYKAPFSSEIQILCGDRQMLLADITKAISDMKITASAISARTTKNKQVIINVTIEINDIEQLRRVIKQLKKIDKVVDVFRVKA